MGSPSHPVANTLKNLFSATALWTSHFSPFLCFSRVSLGKKLLENLNCEFLSQTTVSLLNNYIFSDL